MEGSAAPASPPAEAADAKPAVDADTALSSIAVDPSEPPAFRLMALDHSGASDEEVLVVVLEMLNADDAGTVKAGIERARSLDDPRISEALDRLSQHADDEIRRAASGG